MKKQPKEDRKRPGETGPWATRGTQKGWRRGKEGLKIRQELESSYLNSNKATIQR